MKISKSRWEEAQEFEFTEWKNAKDAVQKEWDESFAKYHSYFSELERRLAVTDLWKILDVGCGPTCVSRMVKKGKHFGIDPLVDLLNVHELVHDVDVRQAPGEKIPFEDKSFDLVICRNAIDHAHEPEKIIREIERVLKAEGYFLLACYVYNPFISLVKNIGEWIRLFRNVGHPHTYTMNSLEGLVRKGFRVLERKIVYEGKSPNDFGKVDEVKDHLSWVERGVLFLNNAVLRQKWFVREYSLLCRKLKGN